MSLDFSQQYDAPIVTTSLTPQDEGEISLRPKLLADYTGQEKAKGNLSVYIEAARRRNEPLDHVLLYGPPGPVSYTHLDVYKRQVLQLAAGELHGLAELTLEELGQGAEGVGLAEVFRGGLILLLFAG